MKKAFSTIAILIICLLILTSAGSIYYFKHNKTNPTPAQQSGKESTRESREDSKLIESKDVSCGQECTLLIQENKELYILDIGNFSKSKILSNSGIISFSPDKSKAVLVDKDNSLYLLTKKDAKKIESLQFNNDSNKWKTIIWRDDGNALAVWQVIELNDDCVDCYRVVKKAEIITHNLINNNSTKLKQFSGDQILGGIEIWNQSENIIGYQIGLNGGTHGMYGDYHTLNLQTMVDTIYENIDREPFFSPDKTELVFISRTNNNVSNGQFEEELNFYSATNPKNILRKYPLPKNFNKGTIQTGHVGYNKTYLFFDDPNLISYNSATNETLNLGKLPTRNSPIPDHLSLIGRVNIIDYSKSQNLLLYSQNFEDNKKEYFVYNLTSGRVKSLGFSREGYPDYYNFIVLGFIY